MKSIRSIIITSLCLLTIHKVTVPQNQLFATTTELTNTQSLAQLLQEQLKKPEYAQEILPNNFTHLMQLLQYGIKTEQPRAYAQIILRRFMNMLKAAPYVNAYAALEMVERLPSLIEPYLVHYKFRSFLTHESIFNADPLERFKKVINTMLFKKFSSHFDLFKSDPEIFLDQLSEDIKLIAQEEVSMQQLKQTTIRFLEIALSKLIWSPEDQSRTWQNVKTISNHLAALLEANIIEDVDALDDMFWTLIHRYCFFIDLTSTSLSLEAYEEIKNDIQNNQLLLFETEEQDTYMETKAECLSRAIFMGKAKKEAYQHGLIIK